MHNDVNQASAPNLLQGHGCVGAKAATNSMCITHNTCDPRCYRPFAMGLADDLVKAATTEDTGVLTIGITHKS